MRILGLDYGDKTIGVSVSDEMMTIAFGVTTVRRTDANSFKKSISELRDIIKKYNIKKIVLGYPKNMDNSEGERCTKTLDFKSRLERNFKNILVVLWDERLSTIHSKKILLSGNYKKHKIENVIDEASAITILQSYLDYENHKL